MKVVVAAFNQEKALVGSFSVLTNLRMELFQALHVTRDVRGTISRHIIPLPDQSRPLQSPPDMFRDEQSLRYPANRWNTGIICNICTGLLWRRRRILHPNYSQMILCGKHPSGPELCVPLQLYNIWYCGDIVTRNLNIEIWLTKTSLGKLKFCVNK